MLLLAKILNKCQGAHSGKYSILSFTCLTYFQVPLKWILSQIAVFKKVIIANVSFQMHPSLGYTVVKFAHINHKG